MPPLIETVDGLDPVELYNLDKPVAENIKSWFDLHTKFLINPDSNTIGCEAIMNLYASLQLRITASHQNADELQAIETILATLNKQLSEHAAKVPVSDTSNSVDTSEQKLAKARSIMGGFLSNLEQCLEQAWGHNKDYIRGKAALAAAQTARQQTEKVLAAASRNIPPNTSLAQIDFKTIIAERASV